MTLKSVKDILNCKKYSELFSADSKEAKKQFREYCKLYHPDANDSEEAARVFAHINEIYSTGMSTTSGGYNGKEEVTFKDKETGKGFTLTNAHKFTTSTCIVYHTSTKVVFVFDKQKYYDNYIKSVDGLKYKDSNMKKEMARYFPVINRHFETEDGQFVIVINKTTEVLNLGEIYKAYKLRGEKIPGTQLAWMINRLYNLTCYNHYMMHRAFNGLSLENLWVSPEMHSILLLGGNEFAVKQGDKMIGVPADVYDTMQIKTKSDKISSISTDLESIRALGRKLCAGNKDVELLYEFFNHGVKEADPLREWKAYEEVMVKQFGKRQFIVWEDVPYTK